MPDQSSADAVDRIVLTAMSRDPGLEEPIARTFAALAIDLTQGAVEAGDAPELARRLMASDHRAGASAASIVAAATVEVLDADA